MGWETLRDGIHTYMGSLIGAPYTALGTALKDGAWTAIARGVWDELGGGGVVGFTTWSPTFAGAASTTLADGDSVQDDGGLYWLCRLTSSPDPEIDASGRFHATYTHTTTQSMSSGVSDAPRLLVRTPSDAWPTQAQVLRWAALGTMDSNVTSNAAGVAQVQAGWMGTYYNIARVEARVWVMLELSASSRRVRLMYTDGVAGDVVVSSTPLSSVDFNDGVDVRLNLYGDGSYTADYRLSAGSWTQVGSNRLVLADFTPQNLFLAHAHTSALTVTGEGYIEDITLTLE